MIPPESTAGPLNPETGTQMPSNPVPIAIVGIGKSARDQHIPTIAADPNFRLAAVVTRNHPIESVPAFATITDMATAMPEVKAISICTPPRGRLDLVREAIAAGLDIMLEIGRAHV